MVSVNHNVVNDNSNNGNNGHNVINDNDLWAKRRAEWSTPDSLLGSNDAGVTAEFVQVKVTGRLQALANQVAKMAAVSSNPNYIAVVKLIEDKKADIGRIISSSPGDLVTPVNSEVAQQESESVNTRSFK